MNIKFLFTLCILSVAFSVSAQSKISQSDLVGSWHVALVKMNQGAVYCDLDKDSVYISDDLKKKWKSNEDSAIAMAMTVGMLKAFQGSHMVFGSDGSYEEKDSKNSRKGSYVFDDASSVFTITYTGTTSKLKARVTRENDLVRIEPLNGKADMQMFLRKD